MFFHKYLSRIIPTSNLTFSIFSTLSYFFSPSYSRNWRKILIFSVTQCPILINYTLGFSLWPSVYVCADICGCSIDFPLHLHQTNGLTTFRKFPRTFGMMCRHKFELGPRSLNYLTSPPLQLICRNNFRTRSWLVSN